MAKLINADKGYYLFYCKGCKTHHAINTNPEYGIVWQFNGDLEKPTASPSFLVNGNKGPYPQLIRCHFFIKDGKIEYLSDCEHDLKNTIIEMEDVE